MNLKENVKKVLEHFDAAPRANCLAFAGQIEDP